MATVTKDFKVKNGLTVQSDLNVGGSAFISGPEGTLRDSDLITADAITAGNDAGGNQNITVTYDEENKKVTFAAAPGYTDEEAVDAVAAAIADGTHENIVITYEDGAISFVAENGVEDSTTADLAEDPAATVDSKTMYFTNERARDAISVESAGPLTYDSETGEIGASIGNGLEVSTGTLQADLNVLVDLDSAQELENKSLGTGTILTADLDADENKIVNLATPTDAYDAVNKAYVDAKAEGLSIKPAVLAATTENLVATYDNGTAGVGATLTATTNGAFPLIDGVQLSTLNGQRGLLVKNQSNAAENGRYNLTTLGDEDTPWVLTRCGLCDTANEIPSAYVFVQSGDLYEATGWVAFVQDAADFTVGTDAISWFQFAGAGTYLAGTNLELDGNTFSLADNITLTSVTADLTGDVTGTVSDISNHDTSDLAEDPAGSGTSGTWYFTNQRAVDALEAVVPNFTAIDINSIAKQVAATTGVVSTAGTVTAYAFPKATYRSGEFLVKVSHGSHTEISKILLTLDSADNVAITEYAIVGTNGALANVSADVDGTNIRIRVTTLEDASLVNVVGTVLA
jgi:hypothetical protein